MSADAHAWRRPASRAGLAVVFPAALIAACFAMLWMRVRIELPGAAWIDALVDPLGVDDLTMRYSVLPRAVIALLIGGTLGLSGLLFQQVLRNPLADPTTLGTSAGAHLFIAFATVFAPASLAYGKDIIALAGAATATLIVFLLARRQMLSPLSLIMGGLIVSLLCGSAIGILNLFAWQYLTSVFIWGAGSLVQSDWSVVAYLSVRVAILALMSTFLLRSLSVLAVGDEGARSLGLSAGATRAATLAIAVSLAAFSVCAVGIIGFIGLAAPAFARLSGARRLNAQLLLAPLWGAALLLAADQAMLFTSALMLHAGMGTASIIPTGVTTALVGAPLMLWLLSSSRGTIGEWDNSGVAAARNRWPALMLLIAVLALGAIFAVAITTGKGQHGWTMEPSAEFLQFRWPRATAALAAGVSLALAGVIMQRTFANAMAAPEVLGVSSGASLGVILTSFVAPQSGRPLQLLLAALGALSALALMLLVSRRSAYSPSRLLLTGVIVTTIFSALVSFLMATGDPRLGTVLTWMSGSTYKVAPADSIIAAGIAGAALAGIPLLSRWLMVLPLGEVVTTEVGIDVGTARLVLVVATAFLAASSTLIVGPLTFVGLMAPHMARLTGLHRPTHHLIGSAVCGAIILVAADWIGRNVMFPYQIPAGLIATLLGAPYFLVFIRRGGA